MTTYPSTPEEFQAARNNSYACKHTFANLQLVNEEASPTKKNLYRLKQTYWCEKCSAIKYAIKFRDGTVRSWVYV